jgi:hypothetical protein
MIVLIIFNKYSNYLNIIKYFKIFISGYAIVWSICLNIAMSMADKYWQYCGVMKFGRHALLSRGWGSQDKHRIMPVSLQSVADWG